MDRAADRRRGNVVGHCAINLVPLAGLEPARRFRHLILRRAGEPTTPLWWNAQKRKIPSACSTIT
jgi:hypothetical protein